MPKSNIPRGKAALSISRLQRHGVSTPASSVCLSDWHKSCHMVTVSEPVSTLTLPNCGNTCAKSLFAKPGWEFSVLNRPQNFSSLPWGEVLWFSGYTRGLHLNHLKSGVRYLLKAASLAFPIRHTWIFSPSFSKLGLREAVFGNALTLYMRRCTW